MFEFLKEINEKLYERYLTLERNIKAASNSFYDSYLDFLEHFVKIAANDCGVTLSARANCGEILKMQEVKGYFINELGVSEYTFNKMQDYTLKVNAHKHKGEKRIEIETIINYMNVLYSITSAYAKSKGIALGEFDVDYYAIIFGRLEREHNEIKDLADNINDKIDKQAETISQVADKFENVSIPDLYALAKRTWSYGDFEMAQKYYNHISLLQPLEWEASFRASLCGLLTATNIDLWERRPKKVEGYYLSTIEYIENRDVEEAEKRADVIGATEILLEVFSEYIEVYRKPQNQSRFDEYGPQFKAELQKSLINIVEGLDKKACVEYEEVTISLCKVCADLLEKNCTAATICISKEKFEKYIKPYCTREIELKSNNSAEFVRDTEFEKKVKLQGKCYLEYKDKVIAKRKQRKYLSLGIIGVIACLFIVISSCLFDIGLLAIGAGINLPFCVVLLVRGITVRTGVRQDSFLNNTRWKYRLTSDSALTCEETFVTPVRIIGYIILGVPIFMCILEPINYLKDIGIIILLLRIVSWLVLLIDNFLLVLSDVHEHDCVRKFKFEGNTYYFDK